MSPLTKDESSVSLLHNSDDEQVFFKSPEPGKARWNVLFLVPLFAGAIISSLLWGVVIWQSGRSRIETTHESSQILHCGSTPAEARALGCEFQLWDFAWTPKPCCDQVIENEYLDARDWGYYLDKEGKEEVDIAVAQSGDYVIWTTVGQHYWHCASTVMKYVRDRAVNSSSLALTDTEAEPGAPHLEHCLGSMIARAGKKVLYWDAILDKMTPLYRQCYVKSSKGDDWEVGRAG